MNKHFDKAVVTIFAGKNKTDGQKKTEIERARIIRKTLGVSVAARYLAIRAWSLDAALEILLGTLSATPSPI